MKVGIITTYRINNYGTKLQAYAMQEILQTLGLDYEIVDYYPKYDFRPHVIIYKIISKIKSKIQKNQKNVADKKVLENKIFERNHAINKFDALYVKSKKIKGYEKLKTTVKDYDCFICGSDQIWAEGNLITDYFNCAFVQRKKPVIAYAPSFGTSHLKRSSEAKYRKFLNDIDYLSTRESSGVDLIYKLTGRKAALVVDPTLLFGKNLWNDLIDKYGEQYGNHMDFPQKYIFCYFLGDSAEHRHYAKKLADMYDYKIITLPHMKSYVDADSDLDAIDLYDVSPIDFLKLIKNAEYICTDSFHGTVFSILFGKKFYTFERFAKEDVNSTNTRIYSLLNSLGLSDQLITATDHIKPCTIDFDTVETKLEELRKFSWDYLRTVFDTIENHE